MVCISSLAAVAALVNAATASWYITVSGYNAQDECATASCNLGDMHGTCCINFDPVEDALFINDLFRADIRGGSSGASGAKVRGTFSEQPDCAGKGRVIKDGVGDADVSRDPAYRSIFAEMLE